MTHKNLEETRSAPVKSTGENKSKWEYWPEKQGHPPLIVNRYYDDQERRCTRFVAEVLVTKGREEETDAIGQKIAAAPELLEALKEAKGEITMAINLGTLTEGLRNTAGTINAALDLAKS